MSSSDTCSAPILVELLNPGMDEDSDVLAVDADHQLIYETDMGEVADDAGLLAAGSLSTTIDNEAVVGWSGGRTGQRPLHRSEKPAR